MVANRRCPAGYLGGFVLRDTFPNTTIQLSHNHPTPQPQPPTLVCHLALCPRVTTTLLLVPLQGYRRFLKQNKTVLKLFWHITWKILNISIFAVEMEFCVVWCWFYVNTDDSRRRSNLAKLFPTSILKIESSSSLHIPLSCKSSFQLNKSHPVQGSSSANF